MSEVLERVLDRGIVIDAWLRVSIAGIALIDVDARVVVASIETYVRQAEAVAETTRAARPAPAPRLRLRCFAGCTFLRTAARCPTEVRCPLDRTRRCPVAPVAAAA